MSDTTDNNDPATSLTVDKVAPDTSSSSSTAVQPKKKFTIIKQVNMIARTAIDDCINRLGPDVVTMSSEDIADQVVNSINVAIAKENARAQDAKAAVRYTPIFKLDFSHVAVLMRRLHVIINIAPSHNSDPDSDMLAIYDPNPKSEHYGIYRTSEAEIRRVAREYCPDLTSAQFRELLMALSDAAPRKVRHKQRDLIPVKNGIFNYSTKQLEPFSQEFVFLAKSAVNYNPDAQNPVIVHPQDGSVWDVESWMNDLSDDEEVVNLLWEIIGAIVRPYVSWNKSAWFYSEAGNNGKGTLVELMRNILGAEAYTSIQLSDFSKEFHLESLTRAQAILVDENDVGAFLEKSANLKAIVTNDVISINRKHKTMLSYQFYGFMVQCINGFPKVKDQSESFFRRQLFVPFEKSFTGAERKYIKDDYMSRTDVLEYVLHRVLHMDYDNLSTPAAALAVLDEYKEFVDPVRAFWNEFNDQFVWDLLPLQFLYEFYRKWFDRDSPSGSVLGKRSFIQKITTIAVDSGEWEYPLTAQRPGGDMAVPEPLVIDYDLTEWQNALVDKRHPNKGIPLPLKANYRGLLRKPLPTPATPPAAPLNPTPPTP